MKITIAVISVVFILSILVGCSPKQNIVEDTIQSVSDLEKCNTISELNRKTLCIAMALKDIRLCEPIQGSFKEECVLVLAEMMYNKSVVSYCDMAKADDNKKICRALVLEDINTCFSSWNVGDGFGASLSMRDCIDLVSRKSKDESNCDVFVSRQNEIVGVCDIKSSDCQGQWIDGANDHADDCKSAVQEAIKNS